jgi:quaternary ammonium compound-resistance protein SugE
MEGSMAYLLVIVAGLFEVGFATFLKLSDGFSRLLPSIGFFVCSAISFSLLAEAAKTLPIGTAYAVWTGIGATGTAILGMLIFNDPVSLTRFLAIALIIGGVVLLNLTGGSHA